MNLIARRATLVTVALLASWLSGCGETVTNKEPKLVGPPDPKIKGPAAIGGGGANQPGEVGIQPK